MINKILRVATAPAVAGWPNILFISAFTCRGEAQRAKTDLCNLRLILIESSRLFVPLCPATAGFAAIKFRLVPRLPAPQLRWRDGEPTLIIFPGQSRP